MCLVGDAIGDGPLELRRERQHCAKNFPYRREIVIGNPSAQLQQLFVKNRREVERFDDLLDFDVFVFTCGSRSCNSTTIPGMRC